MADVSQEMSSEVAAAEAGAGAGSLPTARERIRGGAVTEAQFTMRSMLIAMAIVAVVAALVGPLVRGLEPDKQFRLLAAWGIWLAACLIWIGYQAKKRFDAERLAGEMLFRLPMFDEKVAAMSPVRRWFNIVAAASMALLTMFFISMIVLDVGRTGVSPHLFSMVMIAFGSVAWISKVVAMLWWRNNVRFCTGGIVWDLQVLLWDYLTETRWSEEVSNILEVKGIDQRNMERKWKISVPPECRDEVQAILDQSIVNRPSIPVGSLAYELGRIPISQAIRHPQLLRYVGAGVFGIVSFVAAFYFVRNGVTGIVEFDRSIIFGFFISVFSTVLRFRWISQGSGRPIVRLSGWLGWQRLVPVALMAGVFYYLGNTVSWSVPGLAYVAGAGFGFVIASGLRSGLRSFDLRENGVVLQGELYWPWATVKLVKWNGTGNSKFVLGRGWRRVVATVPREQREAVTALLDEKLLMAKEGSSSAE